MSANTDICRTVDEPCAWGEQQRLRARVDAYEERMRDGHVLLGRKPDPDAVRMGSNDYLSLSGHPTIVEAQTAALEGGNSDLYMSAVFLNETSLQRAVERQMAAFVHAESAILCQSGWCANTGLLQALADASTPVYIDHLATTSLWEGARAAGAPIHGFRHNQPGNLERQIRAHGPGFIVADSIYAADGTICPIEDVVAVGERHGCIVIVDESHAIGVCGPYGEGLVTALGLTSKVHYRTFSLSKAFVTRAGMVVGPRRTMSYFPFEARPAIFSSAVLPHEVAGLAATLKVIQGEDWRRQQLWYNARYLRSGLRRCGFAVDQSASHIIVLHTGDESRTVAFRDVLESEGVFGAVLCAPATPRNHGCIRLSVNAGLSEADLDRVTAACDKARRVEIFSRQPGKLFAPAAPLGRSKADREVDSRVGSLRAIAAKMRTAAANWRGKRDHSDAA